jgi:hypothetical protein
MPSAIVPSEFPVFHPEFFRVPRPARWKVDPLTKSRVYIPSETDRLFGFTRSHYYDLEQRGVLKLIRIRREGKQKGVTLVRFRDVWNYVQKQITDQREEAA